MKEVLDKLIAKLDRKLSEARKSNPSEESLKGWFMFGHHKVSYIFDEDGCVLDVFNVVKGVWLVNVEEYCTPKCIRWSQIDVEVSDEWDEHGFADEADYLRYRYG